MTQNLQRLAASRLSLLPNRVPGPRNGIAVGSPAQTAGDLFWKCAVECFKPVYTRIDARFTERLINPKQREKHADVMSEAKKILQEHRNDIFERVLPMFAVRLRRESEPLTLADEHAHDYFCKNIFVVMVDMLCAELPSFVKQDEVEQTELVIRRIADVQKDRLEKQLVNFVFEFRPVVAPTRIRKGKV